MLMICKSKEEGKGQNGSSADPAMAIFRLERLSPCFNLSELIAH